MKLKELVNQNTQEALNKLAGAKLPSPQAQYAVLRILKASAVEMEAYHSVRKPILDEHGTLNAETGVYSFPDGASVEAVNQKINDLVESEMETFKFPKFKLVWWPVEVMTVQDMAALEWLLDVD